MAQKNVPKLDDAGTDYEDYKIRVKKWCRLSKIKKNDQAETLQLEMTKKPFGITKRIPYDVLHSANGVQELLNKLDEHFIPDKLQHTMAVWENFILIKRKQNELMINHIQKFMDAFESFQDIDAKIECPDMIVAMLLLTSCSLNDEDKKIITAQMEEPPATKNLIGILKRVMTADKTARETNDTESSDILLTRDNRRPYCPARRKRSERYENGNSYERERGPRKNPIGSDGRRRRCMVCDSIWHYVNDCPEVKKLKRDYRDKKDDDQDHEEDHEVRLSL